MAVMIIMVGMAMLSGGNCGNFLVVTIVILVLLMAPKAIVWLPYLQKNTNNIISIPTPIIPTNKNHSLSIAVTIIVTFGYPHYTNNLLPKIPTIKPIKMINNYQKLRPQLLIIILITPTIITKKIPIVIISMSWW